MKFLVAVIGSFKLDGVREGLSVIGIQGVTASEADLHVPEEAGCGGLDMTSHGESAYHY